MFLSFVGRLGVRSKAPKSRVRRPVAPPRFRPSLLSLEGREVPAAPAIPVGPLGAAQAAAPISQLSAIAPLTINSVTNEAGQLVAHGALGSTPFTAPLTLATSPNASTADCPILNLHLGPINLNLLGLQVKTSEICLSLTALPGSGNLLGNLLCDVSHLLDTGTPLGTILGGLSSTDVSNLTGGLTGLLNGALTTILTPFSTPTSQVSVSPTNILHLSVGPVDLNLLGLDVKLNNCANPAGPVTVDINAVPGPGNLLGNLLSDLSHLLDRPGNRIGQLGHLLHEITSVIGGLI